MEETCKPCTAEEREEILEEIWTTLELDRITPQPGSRIALAKLGNGQRLSSLIQGGDIRTEADKAVLTEQGYQKAKEVVRNHRLSERLLHDVLNLQSEEMERSACRYEHMLDTEAADSICILLGHPRTCPHGKYIPPGECCDVRRDIAEAARGAPDGTRFRGRRNGSLRGNAGQREAFVSHLSRCSHGEARAACAEKAFVHREG